MDLLPREILYLIVENLTPREYVEFAVAYKRISDSMNAYFRRMYYCSDCDIKMYIYYDDRCYIICSDNCCSCMRAFPDCTNVTGDTCAICILNSINGGFNYCYECEDFIYGSY